MSEQPEDRATDRPEITTAPPDPSPPRRGRIPAHLGRARTSTVVLAVLFLAIGALYLNVRPDPPGTATTGGGGVEQPAEPTSPAPTTEPPPTTAPAEPTESAPTTTEPTTEPTEETPPAPTSVVPTSPGTTVPPTGTPSG